MMRAEPARRAHERGGRRAEALAALLLQAKLYRIIGRRVKTPAGEIDLIAMRFGTLAFVEVKSRGDVADEAAALAAVNRQRIARAASLWLARHAEYADRPHRFDVIFLAPRTWPRHIESAFDATGIV